jgi:hypothetical protein
MPESNFDKSAQQRASKKYRAKPEVQERERERLRLLEQTPERKQYNRDRMREYMREVRAKKKESGDGPAPET